MIEILLKLTHLQASSLIKLIDMIDLSSIEETALDEVGTMLKEEFIKQDLPLREDNRE